MFVAQGKSYEYNGIDDNPTAGAGHHETEHCNLISFPPEPLAGNRVPLNRYLLVRNHELLTSPWFEGFMDCKASKQRWRDLNQKRQLCSAWEKVRSDTYAPGKPGADRDMDEYDEIVRGEIPKAFERRAEELRAEREREMERERPPFLRDRDRSRSRSRSRLGAHPPAASPTWRGSSCSRVLFFFETAATLADGRAVAAALPLVCVGRASRRPRECRRALVVAWPASRLGGACGMPTERP